MSYKLWKEAKTAVVSRQLNMQCTYSTLYVLRISLHLF